MKILHQKLLKAPLLLLGGILQLGVFALYIYSIRFPNKLIAIVLAFEFVLKLILALALICRESNSSYKSFWLVFLIFFPIFSCPLYVITGRKRLNKSIISNLESINKESKLFLDSTKSSQISYLSLPNKYQRLCQLAFCNGEHPIFINSDFTYFDTGEQLKDAMLSAISHAKRYIFLEFFIFEEGEFLDELISILKQRVACGVEVKIIYDDFGCRGKLKKRTIKALKKIGISMSEFNPIKNSFNLSIRDHRKIVVVDGTIAFCGGINISDKYVNITHPFKHWRDDGVMLKNSVAAAFANMFLCQYRLINKNIKLEFSKYLPQKSHDNLSKENGFIQPICDGVSTKKRLIKNVILSIIHMATSTLCISTPYLLLDDEVLGALSIKAQSGVNVKILVPHIPDKKFVFKMTRAFSKLLALDNVKIYEYSLGFNHAKCVIADKHIAYIGSCNFDYRSFYLNYECGILLIDCDKINDIQKCLNNAISSSEFKKPDHLDNSLFKSLWRGILRQLAQFF